MPPLRVAHLVQSFALGGLERMMCALARGTRDAGLDCVATAYLDDGPIRHELEEGGVRASVLAAGSGLRPWLPVELAAWLTASKADVLHTHHLGPALYGALAARLAGVPLVHTEHSVEFYDVKRRRVLGAALDRLGAVVAVSHEVAAWRARNFGQRCRVIENGVAPPPASSTGRRRALRASLSIADPTFVVGCVARLAPEKNHALLLRALRDVPDAHLVLLGTGPERGALEAHAQRLELSSRVHFLGARSDVEQWWCAFDLAVLTSTREGQPLALLEAMASGVPVLATAVGGVPELLADGAGALTPSGDAAALAGALRRLSADESWRRGLAQRGARRVSERHSMSAMVARYVELYRSLTAGAPGRSA